MPLRARPWTLASLALMLCPSVPWVRRDHYEVMAEQLERDQAEASDIAALTYRAA
jgi:hypothetical protein